MCFSVAIDKDIKKLSQRFSANFSEVGEQSRQKLFTQQSTMDQIKFERLLGLSHSQKRPIVFRMPAEDNRVFPGYFANVLTIDEGQRVFHPMRYRVRPEGSREEIPDKFGVYNARIDSLTSKKTWQPLFMRRHGLVPFTNFYEWVLDPQQKKDLGLFDFLDEDDKKELGENTKATKRLITFSPEGRDMMWAPCLWDEWQSINGEIAFKSFAIITDDPPQEVEMMGHDRCPIFLREEYISEWLCPEKSNVNEIFEILKSKENVKFLHRWVY